MHITTLAGKVCYNNIIIGPKYENREAEDIMNRIERNPSEYAEIDKFCSEVTLIIATQNERETAAVLDLMKSPPNRNKLVVHSANLRITLGMYGEQKTAMVEPEEQGVQCEEDIVKALELCKNAKYVIGIGVAYAASKEGYALGDVLVSKEIYGIPTLRLNNNSRVDHKRVKSMSDSNVQKRIKNVFLVSTVK